MNAANDTAPAVATSAIVTVWEIRGKNRVRAGVTYTGSVTKGHSAQIAPGAWIRLFGTSNAGTPVERTYCREFKVGDVARHGAYNFDFTGYVRAITAKTVTIVDGSEVHRMSLADFDGWNHNFDVEESHKQRAAWSD